MKNLIYILLLVLLFSCKKENKTDEQSKIEKKYYLDISNATKLVVYDNVNQTQKKNLYKITINGNVEKVNVLSETVQNNLKSTSLSIKNASNLTIEDSSLLNVQDLYKLNDYLFILQGYFVIDNIVYFSILLNKNDGAIYNFNDKIDKSTFGRIKYYSFQSDGDSIYYYISEYEQGVLKKINISDLNNISVTNALPFGQVVKNFRIDYSGNIMYSDECAAVVKLFLPKQYGRIEKVYDNDSYCSNFFLGLDSNFYHGFTDGSTPHIKKIIIQNTTVSSELIWNGIQWDNTGNLNHDGYRIFYRENSIVFVNLMFSFAWEFFGNDRSVVTIPLPNCQIKHVASTNDYLYIADDKSIYKIALNNYENVKLTDNEYELYTVSVNEYNIVSFSGLKYSNGSFVIGEINQEESINIISENKDFPVKILERIN